MRCGEDLRSGDSRNAGARFGGNGIEVETPKGPRQFSGRREGVGHGIGVDISRSRIPQLVSSRCPEQIPAFKGNRDSSIHLVRSKASLSLPRARASNDQDTHQLATVGSPNQPEGASTISRLPKAPLCKPH